MDCKHPRITTYVTEDGEPCGLWGCEICHAKFVPIAEQFKAERERDTAMDERIAAGKRIEELERQRDELLKAIEGVLPFLTGEYWPGVIADTAVDFAVATARKVAAAKVTQS